MTKSPTAAFLDLGRLGSSAWWRYLLGIIIIVGGFVVAGTFMYVIVILSATHGKTPHLDPSNGRPIGVDPMINYIAVNLPLFGMLFFTYIVVRFLHGRPLLSLITAAPKFNWRRLALGIACGLLIAGGAGLGGSLIFRGDYKFIMPGVEFFAWLPIIFFMTPIQSTAEELFFRGYLLQAFGKNISNIWLAAFINGLCFMVPHLWNPEVSYGIVPMAICYFAVGMLLALFALRTGGLEMSIGIHIANNLFDGLILNDVKSVLTTRSLFVCTQGHPWYEAIALIAIGAVLYMVLDKRLPRALPGSGDGPAAGGVPATGAMPEINAYDSGTNAPGE